jgi:hypothetical protein
MTKDWQELTRLTQGKEIVVERVRLADSDIAIEGDFELPPLARLKTEDQIFAAAFLKCHGSIKQMEKYFGVSYPTIKSRLNKIGEMLDFVKIESEPAEDGTLDMLENGEISVEEAIKRLSGRE